MRLPSASVRTLMSLLAIPFVTAVALWCIPGEAAGGSGAGVPGDLTALLEQKDYAAVDARIQAVFGGLIGKPFPDATLVDLKGKKKRLSELRGQALYLFYAGGPVAGTMAKLKELESDGWSVPDAKLLVVVKTLDSVYATKAPFRDKVGFYEFEQSTLPEPLRYLIVYPSYFRISSEGLLTECQLGASPVLTTTKPATQ